jgi:CxxC motif-containing protein (DUF1111 family)
LDTLGYGPLAQTTQAGLRRAPSLAGVGLLAQIPEREILSRADSENEDGVAGRASWITDGKGRRMLGRFGWKATQSGLAGQTDIAFSRDIGLSTTEYPAPWGDCTKAEEVCRLGPHGAMPGGVEVTDDLRDMIVAYLRTIPAPANTRAQQRGEAVFKNAGCAACHATLHLADGTPVRAYTDLLLHDLGAGLDDGIREGGAAPGQWRTAPLWDVADTLKAGGLLHDGRAPDVAQAIEWHGGEAASARARFDALTKDDKAALLAFVRDL